VVNVKTQPVYPRKCPETHRIRGCVGSTAGRSKYMIPHIFTVGKTGPALTVL